MLTTWSGKTPKHEYFFLHLLFLHLLENLFDFLWEKKSIFVILYYRIWFWHHAKIVITGIWTISKQCQQ